MTLAEHPRHFARVIGPWPATDAHRAEAVLARYFSFDRVTRSAPHRAAPAARFADHLPVVRSIEPGGVPAAERAALIALTSDLYPAVQIRCAFAEVPEPGECVRDPQWHAQVRST